MLYLLMGITGIFGILYVPSKIIVTENISATVNNIVASEMMFRLGIISRLICQTIFVFLVLALYKLFKDVNKSQARLMVALVLVAVPIAFLYELNQIAALILVGGELPVVLEQDQLYNLVALFLKLYDHGVFAVEIFWGLWLFPFGWLAYKSGFIPKIIGILLMIACVAYIIESFTKLVIPDQTEFISKVIPVLTIGELVMMLWLVIAGIKRNYSAPEVLD